MICGGVQATFSVLEASEVKFPALRGFVLPTDIHGSRGTDPLPDPQTQLDPDTGLKLGFPQCLSDFLVPGANCPLVEEGTTPRGEQPKILFYERHWQ